MKISEELIFEMLDVLYLCKNNYSIPDSVRKKAGRVVDKVTSLQNKEVFDTMIIERQRKLSQIPDFEQDDDNHSPY